MFKTIAKICGKCFVIEAGTLAIFLSVCSGTYMAYDQLLKDEDKTWKRVMYAIMYCIGIVCSGRLLYKQASNMIEDIDVDEEAE